MSKQWSTTRIRDGLLRGRIRMVDNRGPSPMTPTFHEALAQATIADLQYVMHLFVEHPFAKRTWREKRMRAMAQRMMEIIETNA